MLSKKQTDHMSSIAYEFSVLMANKYKEGVEEHGGNLWQMPFEDLLNNAIEEAIDQVVYLLTMKQQYDEEKDEVQSLPQDS